MAMKFELGASTDTSIGQAQLHIVLVICEIKLVRDAIVRNLVDAKLAVLTESYRVVEDWRPSAADDDPVAILYWKQESSSYPSLRCAISSIISISSRSRIIIISEILDVNVMKQAYLMGAKAFISVQFGFDMLRSVIQIVISGNSYFISDIFQEGRVFLKEYVSDYKKESLSDRQREITECVSRGMSNKEIASYLVLKENSVKAHLVRIRRKMGARNRSEIAFKYWKN